MRTLCPYILRRWRALAGAGGATVVLSAAELAKPWPLAIVVDHLLTGEPDFTLLALVAALILAVSLAESVAQYFADLWLQSAGERIAHELRTARASISQCGYNTALDIVRTRVPALVVPYATPEEDEQTRRAERLQQLGLVLTGELDYERLLAFEPSHAELDLNGAQATTELLAA